MEKTIAFHSSALLRNKEGKFLFLKRSGESTWEPNKWQLPGGKLEWGETPLETVLREVNEETGLVPRNVTFFSLDTMRVQLEEKDIHVINATYTGEVFGDVVLSADHTDFAWRTPKEAVETLDIIRRLRVFLREHFKIAPRTQ